jgi:hypothetical protein
MEAKVPSCNAMGFHHSDGFVPAWKQAIKFAGEHGRIGTMLDVVDARLAADINSFPWNTYFTTTSAEYFGYSKGGVRILIVAHGIGPMSTLEGILKAYSYEYKDKERNRRGGRIPQSEFQKLEDGFYGEVSVVEFDPACSGIREPSRCHGTQVPRGRTRTHYQRPLPLPDGRTEQLLLPYRRLR